MATIPVAIVGMGATRLIAANMWARLPGPVAALVVTFANGILPVRRLV